MQDASSTDAIDQELEEEVDPSRIVFGMSLGASHDDDEEGGLTRSVQAGSKVGPPFDLF